MTSLITNKTIQGTKIYQQPFNSIVLNMGFRSTKQDLSAEAMYLDMLLEQQKQVECLKRIIRGVK